MTTSHLNLKWTVADVDQIVRSAREGATAEQIASTFPNATAEEIERICADARQFVRRKSRVSAR